MTLLPVCRGRVVAETDDDRRLYQALDFDIGPAPSDPRWPGRRYAVCGGLILN